MNKIHCTISNILAYISLIELMLQSLRIAVNEQMIYYTHREVDRVERTIYNVMSSIILISYYMKLK
jgi:hypothetical protein